MSVCLFVLVGRGRGRQLARSFIHHRPLRHNLCRTFTEMRAAGLEPDAYALTVGIKVCRHKVYSILRCKNK